MDALFLKVFNMSVSASWLVLAVLLVRVVLKKAPKWTSCVLWALVAVRLLCPVSFESGMSLVPSSEPIAQEILMAGQPADHAAPMRDPAADAELPDVPAMAADTREGQVDVSAAFGWMLGAAAMVIYAAAGYARIRRKVRASLHLGDNIWICDDIQTPFILGCFKPKIYIPSGTGEEQLPHIIAHENAHLKRRDHWWKPLGFFILAIHWFNPLVWAAFILLCRDIELACDEKVVRELDQGGAIAYSQALLSCSVDRRMVMVCPLAFGEVGVKERVRRALHYRKPALWLVAAAAAAGIVLGICFLTDPRADREFPINGENVSELDTMQIIGKIAEAENLDDGSLLFVNGDNFDLMLTPDFKWANDGAVRFFYMKSQRTYSAQLRMFHDDNKYFITDPTEWIEQDKIFLLLHYLDALKYMPQEEIRQLSPDADGYSVEQVHEGAPSDYERLLKYSQNGINDNDGWYIHLAVQPLHEVDGAYNGSGDEVIHLFYNSGDSQDDIGGKTYIYENEGIMGNFTIALYEDGTFTYYEGMASSYIGIGSWMVAGDIIVMTDDGYGGQGLVNHFRRDGDDLVFVEKDSSNFIYVKVRGGERFRCTGTAFQQDEGGDGTVQLMPSRRLTLDDVVALSRKGQALTWSDFDDYAYTETGSGLYIRLYEIDARFHLALGGAPDRSPMYICLGVNDGDADSRIDIRDGGVEEFIAKDHSDILLSSAVNRAVLERNKPVHPDGLLHCANFLLLGQQSLCFDSDPPAPMQVIAYGIALHQAYGFSGHTFHRAGGSHIPTAVTFEVVDGEYILKEYWVPRDGGYYASDVRDKFPDDIEDEAMDTEKYIRAQSQDCYDQAVRYGGVDTEYAVEYLFEVIESSPAESSGPADYIDAHPGEYRELTYYGRYTMEYIFGEFLEGGQVGLRGQLMRVVLDDLAPEAKLRLAAETGQEYFDQWKAAALRVGREHDPEWIEENQPAVSLLLEMMGE